MLRITLVRTVDEAEAKRRMMAAFGVLLNDGAADRGNLGGKPQPAAVDADSKRTDAKGSIPR